MIYLIYAVFLLVGFTFLVGVFVEWVSDRKDRA